MVTVIKSPRVVTETSTSRSKDWTFLSNFTNESEVAECNYIGIKTSTYNKPSPVQVTDFGFDIPSDAVIKKITVIYRDRMDSYSTDVNDLNYPQFGNSSISLVGCEITDTIKAYSPLKNFQEYKVDFVNPHVTVDEINSPEFGVDFQYTYNSSNTANGVIYNNYIKLEVEYDVPRYNVSISEPRYAGREKTWSSGDDPTILQIGEECSTTVYFRTLNGIDGGVQTIRLNFPINYKMLEVTPNRGELIIYEDQTYVDWVVNPPLTIRSDNQYDTVKCTIKFTPRAFSDVDMVSATVLSTGVKALYYVYVDTELNFNNDVSFLLPRLQRLTTNEELAELKISLSVDIPKEVLEFRDYPLVLKLWSIEQQEYVPFTLVNTNNAVQISLSNKTIECNYRERIDNGLTYNFVINPVDYSTYSGNLSTILSVWFYDFKGDVGEYEFRLFVPHGSDFGTSVTDFINYQQYDMYRQSAYIETEGYCECTFSAERWEINTPNIATTTHDGGMAFLCKTANGFQWKTRMEGSKCILEQRTRHIGGLRLPKSHYEPKLKFSNKVNEGKYKNRAYYNKTGQWEHDLSLNIYLPKFHWRTLQEFVKMDKPVSIDTCPTCDDDDVLNHRGWVEVEDISNVERVNNWWYKGEIGVKRITDKYYGRASIVKGNRVCTSRIPYSMMNTVRLGEYYLGYFDLIGGGQLIYDKDLDIINQIIVPTGENLHLRSKWASKDIDDYKFNWRCVQPSDPTDESNDYKYNSIVYKIINNLTGQTVLTYTLYDFTTFDEIGEIVNTCKASCTVFDKDDNPRLLFTKTIRLDYTQTNPMEFYSTTRFEFEANELSITETGMNGQELMERNILLTSGEYLLDIAFCNNDVGLLEPDFIAYLNMDLKENILANPLSNFYPNILVSNFVLPNLKLLFYRYSDDGLVYYYYGDTTASYLVDGYQQYKGGVDLQTSNGSSILYVDTYTQALFLNNGLIKIGFDRQFGTVSFYTYDYSVRKFIYVNMVRLNDWTEFDILAITDDKAVIQFGETIWTMWRGHPFVQCEHINTDLKINDDYDTINSEAIITQDGDIVYDGSYGKKEVYLLDSLVSAELTVSGNNAPSFISGDTITLKAYLKDKYNDYIANNYYEDADNIGKMEFIINDTSTYFDPTPQIDNQGRWFWEYTFVPPAKNGDYQAYTRFFPVGEFTEATSNAVRYNVRKLGTSLSIINYIPSVNLSAGTYDISFRLKDENNTNLANKTIAVFCNGTKVRTAITDTNGMAVYSHTLSDNEFIEFYGIFDGDVTYELVRSESKKAVVVDDNKAEVVLVDECTVGENGAVTLKFSIEEGVTTGDVVVTVNGEEYTFPISETRNITLPKPDNYPYYVEYQGDAHHNKAMLDEVVFHIAGHSTSIELDPISPSEYNLGEAVELYISGSISNMPYTLYDNESPVATGYLSNYEKTVRYTPSYVGHHLFRVRYAGDTWHDDAESSVRNMTVRNSTTQLIHSNDAVYKNTKDYVRLLDNNNEPLTGKQVRYTVNGITYTRTTDSSGYIGMDINLLGNQSYPVHVVFNGDSAYQTSTLDYVLQVKEHEVQWQPAHSFHRRNESKVAPYQVWNNLGFDGLDGSGYCTCGYSNNLTEVIQSKNSTYHTPDQITFYNFELDIPTDAVIKEIRVRIYERQYNPKSGGMPSIGNAVVSFANHDSRTCSQPPLQANSGYNINEVSWLNPILTPTEVNHRNFSINVDHSQNISANTGALMLKYFEVGIVYAIQTTRR